MTESPLERIVRRAFQAALRYNKGKGWKEPTAAIRRNRAGVRMIGPRSYRLTLFLTPELFGELEDLRSRSTRYQNLSLSSFIVGGLLPAAVERRLNHGAERPAGRRAGRGAGG